MRTINEKRGQQIWRDEMGGLWTLADSGIDTEMFELVGDPIYNEVSELFYQEIRVRIEGTSYEREFEMEYIRNGMS